MEYTREQLIDICQQAMMPQAVWTDRHCSSAVRQVGECFALLKAGCDFKVVTEGAWKTDDRIIVVEIKFKGFMYMEDSDCGLQDDTFYLPTENRLERKKGKDWY